MVDAPKPLVWMEAVAEAARAQRVDLPALSDQGMGVARSEITASGRFATLKRRLVRVKNVSRDAMEWTLWETRDDFPNPIASLREPVHPQWDEVQFVLSLLKSWLVEGRTSDETNAILAARKKADAP